MWFIDFTGIVKDYFKENYRNIAITALGLIFIVSIFSVTLTSEYGLKYDYIQSQLESNIDISFTTHSYNNYLDTDIDTKVEINVNEIITKATTNGLGDIIHSDNLSVAYSECITLNDTDNTMITDLEYGYIQGPYKNILENSSLFSGRFPESLGEVLMIKGGGDVRSIEGEEITPELDFSINESIVLSEWNREDDQYENYTVKIVGIYDTRTIIEYNDYYTNDLNIINNPVIRPGMFITSSFDSFDEILRSIDPYSDRYHFDCQFTISLTETLDPNSFTQFTNNFEHFLQVVSWDLHYDLRRYEKNSPSPGYRLRTFWRIEEFSDISYELMNSAISSLILMIPALSITVFFSSFTSNIFFNRRKRQIGLLRIRGISRKQLLGVLVVEGMASGFISLVAGYILGIVLASFTIKSKGFLDYQFNLESVTISVSTFNTVLFWTIIFAGMIIVNRIIGLSRLTVIESRNPVEKKPFYRRLYIDIILLVLGIAGNGFYFYMMFNPNVMYTLGPLAFILAILTLLLIPFPFFLLFGGIMTLSRTLSPIVSFVSHRIWQRFANIFSYSMTTITRQEESAIRTILLISLTFAMIWTAFTIPPVLVVNNHNSSYYSVGADCYLDMGWNATVEDNIFAKDSNITSFTPVGRTTMRLLSSERTMDVLIISDNFTEVAFFDKSYGNKSSLIDILNRNMSILMDKRGMEDIGREIGDKIEIPDSSESLSLEIIGSFTYWPRLVTEYYPEYWGYHDDPKVVFSYGTMTRLYEIGAIDPTTDILQGYYFKLSPDANYTLMKENYGEMLRITEVEIAEDKSSLSWGLLWLHLNVLFLINTCTIVLAIILYGYKQVRGRARELSVERSLGMKQLQISKLFFYESVTLLGFSYVFGSILGFLFSASLVSIIIMATATYAIPPPVIFFPFDTINVVLLLLIISGLIASIIPSYLARKQDITKSLKVN